MRKTGFLRLKATKIHAMSYLTCPSRSFTRYYLVQIPHPKISAENISSLNATNRPESRRSQANPRMKKPLEDEWRKTHHPASSLRTWAALVCLSGCQCPFRRRLSKGFILCQTTPQWSIDSLLTDDRISQGILACTLSC